MKLINIYQAKTELSRLVDEAIKGKEVIIGRNGKPLVRLTPVFGFGKRKFGGLKGKISVREDFDAPLPDDILESFSGEE